MSKKQKKTGIVKSIVRGARTFQFNPSVEIRNRTYTSSGSVDSAWQAVGKHMRTSMSQFEQSPEWKMIKSSPKMKKKHK